MEDDALQWRPGSFTKNFSWGTDQGLAQLHQHIRDGFASEIEDVPRHLFRTRVALAGRPDFIPINFFLFNKIKNGVDYLVADELVFQAITAEHSERFDKLALFAFNFSYVGTWKGADSHQRRPALWATHYIRDRVAKQFAWDTSKISADDIEDFLRTSPRYIAKTTRKVATNLNHLYRVGKLNTSADPRVERWWVDALFLALDRLIEDRLLSGVTTEEENLATILVNSGFTEISGKRSLEKELAARHLVSLYAACGSRDRFSDEHVRNLTERRIPTFVWEFANDNRPQGAVHPTNPRILKTIPRACAMLAKYVAGFEIIDADELISFDAVDFIRRHTAEALGRLSQQSVRSTLSAEELDQMMRDK